MMTEHSHPECSVVITAYNKGRFIGQTIESVLRQTYQDFEVIVIDDGSTDNTKAIVGSFNDDRIRYLYQPNSGLPACARNKGMELSRGKYIALLDGDDIWYPEKLKRCKEALDWMPGVGLVCHNIAIMHNGRVMRKSSFGPYAEEMYKRLVFEGNCLNPLAVVFRREVFFRDGLKFNESRDLFALEDYEYWLQVSRKHRFYLIEDVLGSYTGDDGGAFSKDTEANAVNMLRLLDAHFANFDMSDPALRRMRKRRRSAIMSAAGRMYNHQTRFDESYRWYLSAAREYRMSLKAYIGITAALLKHRIVYYR